ncbi:MAG: PcfJ domain-containing protein [Oscillospiraceae bacterium]|jgi:Zn finger protein HypA/HybF involved in hydrogenase expression|nr:PcfJ domain-containing protein [Oscillospiraceae bacterium]
MNKRFLAKIPIADADSSLIEVAGRLVDSNIKYIAVGRIVPEGDKRILLLHFFKRDGLKKGNTKAAFRTFINDDYITQRLDCQPYKWQVASLDNIIGFDWINREVVCWYNRVLPADEKTVKSIRAVLGKKDTPLQAVDKFQHKVKADRLAKKHQVITKRIDEKMSLIKKLPADFEEWLHKTAFAEQRYIFYKYKSGRKLQQGYCEACRTDVEIKKPRHKKEGSCPHCKCNATYIVHGRSKSADDLTKVSVMQKIPDGFAVRHFRIERRFENCKPKYKYHELFRDLYESDCKVYPREYFFGKFKNTDIFRWCEDKSDTIMGPSTLYTRNLNIALKGTQWQYSAIKEYAAHQKGFKFSVWRYLHKYREKKYLEYFVKLKLYRLVGNCLDEFAHSINHNGNNLVEILRIKKQYVTLLQELNANIEILEIVQQISNNNFHATAAFVTELIERHNKHQAKEVAEMLKHTSYQRLLNYLNKRVTDKDTLSDVFITWKDYIENCEILEYDLSSDFILFPKRLKRMHDIVDKRVTAKNEKERAGTLGEMSKDLGGYFTELQNKYGFSSEEFVIISPKNLNEIVKEGHKLRHCGGRYAENAGEKKTVIMFLRRITCTDIPFFTIEIKGNELIQCRGLRNCSMTDEVKSFIQIYKKSVLQNVKRKVRKSR